MESQDVVLKLKVLAQWLDQIILEKLALGNQWVDLLLFYFPADSEDKQGNLDTVELVDKWVHLWLFVVTQVLVNINQIVHLLNSKDIKVLMEDKQFCFMIQRWLFNGRH